MKSPAPLIFIIVILLLALAKKQRDEERIIKSDHGGTWHRERKLPDGGSEWRYEK